MASSPDRATDAPTAVGAFLAGFARVGRARAVWVGMWALTLALGLPVSFAIRGMIAAHLDDSLAADRVAQGIDWDWWQEFQQQAAGLGTTFVPAIIGGAAPARNISDIADNVPLPLGLVGMLVPWLLLWSFASGGVFDRMARNRPVGGQAFFGACGRYALRLVRLGLLAWGAYWLLFAYVHSWIFVDAYESLVRDLTVERTAFLVRVAGYAIFLCILAAINMVFDYARIRLVVEDRRSAIFAVVAGARFVWRHLALTTRVYALNAGLFLVLVGLYVAFAPGGRNDGSRLWLALVAGQAYIAARVVLKLQFIASQVGVFQRALAAEVLVAGPAPEWPESPAAELVRDAGGPAPYSP